MSEFGVGFILGAGAMALIVFIAGIAYGLGESDGRVKK